MSEVDTVGEEQPPEGDSLFARVDGYIILQTVGRKEYDGMALARVE